MNVNGFQNVKSYITREYPCFMLYEYYFENGNKIRECYTKWKQRDFTRKIRLTPEEHLERRLDTLADRR